MLLVKDRESRVVAAPGPVDEVGIGGEVRIHIPILPRGAKRLRSLSTCRLDTVSKRSYVSADVLPGCGRRGACAVSLRTGNRACAPVAAVERLGPESMGCVLC